MTTAIVIVIEHGIVAFAAFAAVAIWVSHPYHPLRKPRTLRFRPYYPFVDGSIR